VNSDRTYIGRSVRRLEDPHLITGRGRFAGDVRPAGSLHLLVVRSSLGHARIGAVDVEAARRLPGVVAIWTADDVGRGAVVDDFISPKVPGNSRPVLAWEVARYAGEPLAAVIAESAAAAADAAALVYADLDPLPVVDLDGARAEGAPAIHAAAEGNLLQQGRVVYGDADAAFLAAAHVVRFEAHFPRICGAAMEPRAVSAWPTPAGGVRVATSTQGVFTVRRTLARLLGLDRALVEVVAEDVGGGFGPKAAVYGEEALVALAAHRLGRPVTWTATRSEDFQSTYQSHGVAVSAELAADADGHILALRGTVDQDSGAYPSMGLIQPPTIITHLLSQYAPPALAFEHRTYLTNGVPTAAVRGGSRPLGNYVIERLVDRLADATGLDRVEVRRRNLVTPDRMPLAVEGTPVVYDSGDFPAMLEAARSRIARPEAEAGRVFGIGVVAGAETSGFGFEPARLSVRPDGSAHLVIGSTPQGQGHRTMAAQVLAERLGWPLELVDVAVADTSRIGEALVTGGSRSGTYLGNVAAQAGREARRRLLEMAAERLEADPADILLDPERALAAVQGVPTRQVGFAELLPAEGLQLEERYQPNDNGIAWGGSCHGAVVSLDPDTGKIEVLRYVIAHDIGRSINPMTVEGQLLGGLVHGLGYALLEEAQYQDGQLVTASFLDYSTATAGEVPLDVELVDCESHSTQNPEGFKGVGESASVMSPAAIASAVEDAIRQVNPHAVVSSLPLTPDRVLALIQERQVR
jgi:carbon-monoxide dehydrogenase large subunit